MFDSTTQTYHSSLTFHAAAKPAETSLPVCIAAAMHLNMALPPDLTLVSPVCFVSVRTSPAGRSCRTTLQIPHAVDLPGIKKELGRFCILTYMTFDLISSPSVECSSPTERRLEVMTVESLNVTKKHVTFKTTIISPALYAVGIRDVLKGVARPLAPLRCVLFCLYVDLDNLTQIKYISVKMFVGLNLPTVTQVCSMCS